jgi:sigma-B regulation protein RsbU (phosphoserine phosphatase)
LSPVSDDRAQEPAAAPCLLRRAAREHRAAQSSQRSLLPASLPQIDGCHLAARWQPCFDLGGDCYDAMTREDARIAISIADVCGKGLPAALVMSHVQASVRAYAAADPAPATVAASVNRALCRNAGLAPFVTLFYATYDARARILAFTNAGHNPPLVVRADGSIDRLTAGGMVLGVFETTAFEHATVRLGAGDRVILFTDGITDASGEGNEFGDEGLIASVLRHRDVPVATLVDRVFDDVSRFAEGDLTDDATVLALAID